LKFPEQQEAEALFKWVQYQENTYPELKLFFAVPNGGARPKFSKGNRIYSPEATRMKKAGVRKGVSDYLFLCARGGFHGMALELKAKGGRLTPEQRVFLEDAAGAGYYAMACIGWEKAREAILYYLNLKDENHGKR